MLALSHIERQVIVAVVVVFPHLISKFDLIVGKNLSIVSDRFTNPYCSTRVSISVLFFLSFPFPTQKINEFARTYPYCSSKTTTTLPVSQLPRVHKFTVYFYFQSVSSSEMVHSVRYFTHFPWGA